MLDFGPQCERTINISNCSNQPVVDMMDSNCRGFQVTTAKKHSLNRKWLQQILHISKLEGKLFEIYYVIPSSNLSDFSIEETENVVFPLELLDLAGFEQQVRQILTGKQIEATKITQFCKRITKDNQSVIVDDLCKICKIDKNQERNKVWQSLGSKFTCYIISINEDLKYKNSNREVHLSDCPYLPLCGAKRCPTLSTNNLPKRKADPKMQMPPKD